MSNTISLRTLAVAIIVFVSPALRAGTGEAWSLEDKNLLGFIATKTSLQISGSPWGIQVGTLENEHIGKASQIGVKWTRLQASWRDIEKRKGVYSWEQTDAAFAATLGKGIIPFVCLSGSNPLYCATTPVTDPKEKEIYGSSLYPPTKDPAAMSAWLAFVRAAVGRYSGQIQFWEVWNEPNHRHYWGAEPDGREYGVLLRETSAAIRESNPNAKVIAGALAGLDPDFTAKFLAGGNAKNVDVITFHNYAEIPEERIYKAVETWKVIGTFHRNIELWQGECGYPSHSSTRDYRGNGPWGMNIQAKWLLRQAFTDVYFCRTSVSNYFKLVHPGGKGDLPKRTTLTSLDSILGFPARGGSRVKSVGVNEKCLLENPSLEPKPAFFAYQRLCAVFDNRYKPIPSEAKIAVSNSGSFYGVGCEDDAFPSIPLTAVFNSENGSHLIAYWLPWPPQEIVQKGTITLQLNTIQFRNPVLIDLLTGGVYAVTSGTVLQNGSSFVNLPMADYPMILAERNEISIVKK
ncbi:MAG: hypothetical protein NTV54_04670 [Ignavibacteriales bacterium]|nr:hypothetical protein [Ignavibacteriales bacterium]